MKNVWRYRGLIVAGAVSLLVGCSTRHAPVEQVALEVPPARAVTCAPAQPGSPLIGRWLSNTRPSGVAGDFRALVVLEADGAMTYDTQLKVGKRLRPGLREAGCWVFADGVLTLQTVTSNGEPIDTSDPIYQNRYRVQSVESARLKMRELRAGGQMITARRMAASYRLPD